MSSENFNDRLHKMFAKLSCAGICDFLNIPLVNQKFWDMDVPKSPTCARMANVGRLRPSFTTASEYLENPYDGAGHERAFCAICHPGYKRHLLTPESKTVYQFTNRKEYLHPMPKYALVTGASRGIGQAIAEALAADGYHLYLTCIHSKEALHSFASALSDKYQIPCIPFLGDMGSPEDVNALFQTISDLDVLINNAGISYVGLLNDMQPKDWRNIMSTNVDAVFYTSRLAIPLMLHKHSGRIINISSVWGNVGASMEVAYSASKGAVNSFTKALAKELAPSHIQVNAIACGLIDTDMNRCFSAEDIATLRQEIPCDRIGEPSEVAQMVKSLLDAPDYLTGQIITLDGGWT